MEHKIETIKKLLIDIGENPEREGLVGTPLRIVNMHKELFRGYDPKQKPTITVFDNGVDGIYYDEMIIDTGKFYSFCEHHMLPFFGQYWFAYIPQKRGKILGLAKVARLVDYHSAKLQIQERLVHDVVDDLQEALGTPTPRGIGLVMKATHLCKSMRGVKKEGIMTTTHLQGLLKTDVAARNEFLKSINNGN